MTEQKLDAFYPAADFVAGVRRQLAAAGVGNVPEDWLVAILAATAKWQTTTQEGVGYTARSLGFKQYRGDDSQDYELCDHGSGEVYPLRPEDIYFYYGATARGMPVDPDDVSQIPKSDEFCECCHNVAYCVDLVHDRESGCVENLCRHCASFKNADISQTCDDCSSTQCKYHKKSRRIAAF